MVNSCLATVAMETIFLDVSISQNDQHTLMYICTKFHAFITNPTIPPLFCTRSPGLHPRISFPDTLRRILPTANKTNWACVCVVLDFSFGQEILVLMVCVFFFAVWCQVVCFLCQCGWVCLVMLCLGGWVRLCGWERLCGWVRLGGWVNLLMVCVAWCRWQISLTGLAA